MQAVPKGCYNSNWLKKPYRRKRRVFVCRVGSLLPRGNIASNVASKWMRKYIVQGTWIALRTALSHMGMTRLRRVVSVQQTDLPSSLIRFVKPVRNCNCGRLFVRDGGVTAPICLASLLALGERETSTKRV